MEHKFTVFSAFNENLGSITGKTYLECWTDLATRLRVSGPRGLVARSDNNGVAEIRASLYIDNDCVIDCRGHDITGRILS